MPDLALVAAVGANIKTAIDIGKAVIGAKGEIDTAELRLRLADMITALADAKVELSGIQDEVRAKDDEIRALHDALQNRDEIVRRWDAYYKRNADGRATGAPYCMACWERNHKLYHLAVNRGGGNICPVCKTEYDGHRTKDFVGLSPDQQI